METQKKWRNDKDWGEITFALSSKSFNQALTPFFSLPVKSKPSVSKPGVRLSQFLELKKTKNSKLYSRFIAITKPTTDNFVFLISTQDMFFPYMHNSHQWDVVMQAPFLSFWLFLEQSR